MAKKKAGKKGGKSKAKKSNQIPLNVLEKRLDRLNNIVKRRNGDAFG